VSFTDRERVTFIHVTAGDTLFEAVSRAMNGFAAHGGAIPQTDGAVTPGRQTL
jgi:hypothetical protein